MRSPVNFLQPVGHIHLNLTVATQDTSHYWQNMQIDYIYKALKIVANYLNPLAKNDYATKDTSIFPGLFM